LKNTVFFARCEHNALNFVFTVKKSVTIKFLYFFAEKVFKVFYHYLLTMLLTKSCEKVAPIFICESCDYNTNRKSSYDKHILTAKHKNSEIFNKFNNVKKVAIIKEKENQIEKEVEKEDDPDKKFACINCKKHYKSRVGLWYHIKHCVKEPTTHTNSVTNKEPTTQTNEVSSNEFKILTNLVVELVKQNNDFKDLVLDQNKQIQEMAAKIGTCNNNINSNNTNKFNINFFLDEKCKDALTIKDFVDQLQIDNDDLEETGRLGFAKGISKIFINGLKDLDLYKRPLHCSDAKRETVYIKNDENEWIKDNDNKTILTKAIKDVANKNIRQISEWQKNNREYSDPDSKVNDKYMKIVFEAMSGSTVEESHKNYEKIVKNIVKDCVIPNTEK